MPDPFHKWRWSLVPLSLSLWLLFALLGAAWLMVVSGEDPANTPWVAPWLLIDASPWALGTSCAWWAWKKNGAVWINLGRHPLTTAIRAVAPSAMIIVASVVVLIPLAPMAASKVWKVNSNQIAVLLNDTLWTAKRSSNGEWRIIAMSSASESSPVPAPSQITFEAAINRPVATNVSILLSSEEARKTILGVKVVIKPFLSLFIAPLSFALGAMQKNKGLIVALIMSAITAMTTNVWV